MSTYPKVDIDGNQFLSRQHETSGRSVESKRLYTEGVTSLVKPFYFSRVVGSDVYATIMNDDTPMQVVTGYYVNGIETAKDANHVDRGESFIDGRLYDEGVTHYSSYAKWDYEKYLIGK